MLNISFKDDSDRRLITALETKGPSIVQVLTVKLRALMFMLKSYIVTQKLSGQVLKRDTGKLAGSIRALPVELQGTNLVGAVRGGGGPALYGEVHEYGGTRAYEVTTVKARALSFVVNGKRVFAKSVMMPPALIRPFMAPSLFENIDNIQAELQVALQAEIKKP